MEKGDELNGTTAEAGILPPIYNMESFCIHVAHMALGFFMLITFYFKSNNIKEISIY